MISSNVRFGLTGGPRPDSADSKNLFVALEFLMFPPGILFLTSIVKSDYIRIPIQCQANIKRLLRKTQKNFVSWLVKFHSLYYRTKSKSFFLLLLHL